MLRSLLNVGPRPLAVAIFLALAGCDASVEVPDDAVACAGIQCTAGQCYSNAGQPMCRCGPWEQAAGLRCEVASFVTEDDCGGSPETASELSVSSEPREGYISASMGGTPDDWDLFSFYAEAGHSYVFVCQPKSLPGCHPRLLDASGRSVPGRLLDTRRTRWLFSELPEGRWYVQISGAGQSGTYSYQLVDAGLDDHGNVIEKATLKEPSQVPFTVTSTFLGDTDVLRFQALANHGYRFHCELPGPEAGVSLRLVDGRGIQVGSAEGLGPKRTPTVDLKPDRSEDWFVEVVSTYGAMPATYTCWLTELGADEHADRVEGATVITPGVPVTVRMHSRQDLDVLAFQTQMGHHYALRQHPAGQVVVRLANPGGAVVDLPSQLPFVPTDFWPNTYHLMVSPVPGTTLDGPVQLVLEDLGPDDHRDSFHGNFPRYPVGRSVNGRFQSAREVDAIAFNVEADGVYQVTCEPECLVMSGVLSGEQAPELLRSRTFDVRDAGFAGFRVWQHQAQEAFTLRVERVGTDDYGERPDLAPLLGVPAVVSGVFEASNDAEVFSVDLQAGRSYRMVASPGTSVQLHGADGIGVWSDGGRFTPWLTGRHSLWVRPTDRSRFGAWDFSLQPE
ncbi:MAG TPA: hypothetical protein VE153_22105 [Myxococcus sp.]|nr:hypothetical protein [Myxococcus sp.]